MAGSVTEDQEAEYVSVPALWLDDVLDVLILDGNYPDLLDEAQEFAPGRRVL
jgi:hypothetical protein